MIRKSGLSVFIVLTCMFSIPQLVISQQAPKTGSPESVRPAATPSPTPSPQPKSVPVQTQTTTIKQLDPAMVKFFTGNWKCSGEFGNGKKIESILSFVPELDGRWLMYRHSDVPPNKFKALSMWGVLQESGKVISVLEDNFGGARLFISDGWVDNSLRFNSAPLGPGQARPERFTYAELSDTTFKMTYEVSRDGAVWFVGDFINCNRQK